MKESMFNIRFKVDEKDYVFNSHSNGVIQVENEDLCGSDKASLDYMYQNRYLVDDAFDEALAVVNETNQTIQEDYEQLDLTLVLTEKCNFNCCYCYQTRDAKVLSAEKADSILATVGRLLEKNKYKRLNIHYFGGEPLLNVEMVRYFDKRFKKLSAERGVVYTSCITTNGSLLTTDLVKEIGFDDIQITVEGLEQSHERLRRSDSCKFQDLIRIMGEILPVCNSLIIRINLCKENEPDLLPLIHYVMETFLPFREKIKFAMSQMVKYAADADFTMLSLSEYATLFLAGCFELQKYGVKLLLPRRVNYSCAFMYHKAFCINPDLSVSYCDGSSDCDAECFSEKIGDNCPALSLKEKCTSCNILPLCLGGCAVKRELGHCECIPEKLIIKDLLINYIEHQTA